MPHEDFQPVIRRVLTLCGMCVAASCGDPSAPSPMTLTLAPASATATGVRGMNGVFSQVTCDLAFTVTAHGGGSSDSIGLSSVTLDWTYAGGFTAQTVETSLVDWFGSNRLAHDASLSAHRSASATTAFTLHVGLHYLTPDGATQLQSFTLVCN